MADAALIGKRTSARPSLSPSRYGAGRGEIADGKVEFILADSSQVLTWSQDQASQRSRLRPLVCRGDFTSTEITGSRAPSVDFRAAWRPMAGNHDVRRVR